MSFLESLFLYNVLEVLVIMSLCNILNDNRFKIEDIKHCYFLGGINLCIQYVNLLIANPMFQLIYNLFVMFVVSPIVTYLYFRKSYKYKIIHGFYSVIFLFLTSSILTTIFNTVFGNVFVNSFINQYYEFIFNILLRAFQLLLIYLLYKGKCFVMKKFLKKIASTSVEQAFTFMNQYQPKVPEKLAKEISEKQ